MKSDLESRPVYLQKDPHIKAHFATCFLALILVRYLEKALQYLYTSSEIIDTLREMDFVDSKGHGYSPAYTRTDLTDALHEVFGFRTDYEILTPAQMKKIYKHTKKGTLLLTKK